MFAPMMLKLLIPPTRLGRNIKKKVVTKNFFSRSSFKLNF